MNECGMARGSSHRQHSRTAACALMSDHGYLLIQTFVLAGKRRNCTLLRICYDQILSKQQALHDCFGVKLAPAA